MNPRLTLAFDRLLSAFLLERYEEIRIAERTLTHPPDKEAVHYFLCRLGIKDGDLKRAEEYSSKLPSESILRFELDGRLSLIRKDFELARESFSKLLHSHSTNWIGLTLTAVSYIDQDNFEAAWPLLLDSFTLKWNDPETIIGLITAGNRLGKFKELEPILLKYLYRSPADMDVRAHYALSLLGQTKMEQASFEVLRILAFDANQPIALELHQTLKAGGFL